MTRVGQKYRCSTCGNEVVVGRQGAGTLFCCGRPMDLTGEGFEIK